jgi:allene oxide cyclase-like protein
MLSKIMIGVLAAATVATGASIASAGNGDDGSDDSGRTIHLMSRTVHETDLDLGDTGFGPGDQFLFADDLFRDDEKVGTDGGSCTVVRVEGQNATINCTATFSLAGGQIAVQGLIEIVGNEERPFTVAVTGGTGRYRDADGEALLEPVSQTEDKVTIRLR